MCWQVPLSPRCSEKSKSSFSLVWINYLFANLYLLLNRSDRKKLGQPKQGKLSSMIRRGRTWKKCQFYFSNSIYKIRFDVSWIIVKNILTSKYCYHEPPSTIKLRWSLNLFPGVFCAFFVSFKVFKVGCFAMQILKL